ncbi:MAG: DNA-3-methyladenine glycosylase [Chitinophagaceae bacterium]|nr:MAG: DNA-3-methyladenine glycosylase [Chitinophagaceae bacterium]
MKKLPRSFYQRSNVLIIARELLGKIVVTNIDGIVTSGRIVETEAYVALTDKASHSFNGRRTAKNEHMYGEGGTSYIYICYGIHQMLNIVTNEKDIPDAVLIRALEPMQGIETMLKRTGKAVLDNTLTKGPGNVGKAMGLYKHYSGISLMDASISLYDDKFELPGEKLGISKRIGVDYAGDDALLPYRFFIKGNPYVSGRPNK